MKARLMIPLIYSLCLFVQLIDHRVQGLDVLLQSPVFAVFVGQLLAVSQETPHVHLQLGTHYLSIVLAVARDKTRVTW